MLRPNRSNRRPCYGIFVTYCYDSIEAFSREVIIRVELHMFHHCEAIIPYIESVIGIGIVKFLFIYSNKTYQDRYDCKKITRKNSTVI